MASIVESVSEATLAALVAGTWSQPFEKELSYADWELPLESLTALRCDVVPHPELPAELAAQKSLLYEVGVELVLRQRFGGEDLDQGKAGRVKIAKVHALVALLLELNEFFTAERFVAFQDAVWTATRIKMLYNPRHLRLHQQFTGIVRMTFEADKDLP